MALRSHLRGFKIPGSSWFQLVDDDFLRQQKLMFPKQWGIQNTTIRLFINTKHFYWGFLHGSASSEGLFLIPSNRQWQWIGEDFAIHLSGSIGDCWVYHIGQHFFGGCLEIGCCTQNGLSSTSRFKYWLYFHKFLHNLRANPKYGEEPYNDFYMPILYLVTLQQLNLAMENRPILVDDHPNFL